MPMLTGRRKSLDSVASRTLERCTQRAHCGHPQVTRKRRRSAMRTKVVTCLVVAAGVLGMASLALAQTNAPKSAKKFQASLVAAYDPCTAPNNSTTTLPCTILEGVTKDFPTGCSNVVDANGGFQCSTVVGPGVLAPGANTDISNNGCALKDGSVHALDCGQFVP